MKLKRRQRVDGVRNEIRAPAKPWGKYFYLCLVGGFLFWLFDLFFGEMFYFHANGLVVQDRVVLATQYDASVSELAVREGERVVAGTAVARLRSQSVEENIAELSADVARMMEQASQLEVRREVIEATKPLMDRRVDAATAAREEVEKLRDLFTQKDRLQRLQDELASMQAKSTDVAEYKVIKADLPQLKSAIAAARKALDRLSTSYAEGVLTAPVDGVVGYLHVTAGSVVSKATPMMELYTGEPYVLAYVPEGAIYELAPGDRVSVSVGFSSYSGVVRQILPISTALPEEYIDALRVPQRAPLARIEFVDVDKFPSLFARTEVDASGWPPRWMLRLLGMATAAETDGRNTPVALQSEVPDIEPEVLVRPQELRTPAFTIQLISLGSRAAVERYKGSLGLDGGEIRAAPDGTRYTLTFGRFEDRASAVAMLAELGVDGWVRAESVGPARSAPVGR